MGEREKGSSGGKYECVRKRVRRWLVERGDDKEAGDEGREEEAAAQGWMERTPRA